MAHFEPGMPARRAVIGKLAEAVYLELLSWKERIAAELEGETREEFNGAFSDMSKMAVIEAITLQDVRNQKEARK